jgi:flagellar FliJ protein
MQRFQFSLEKVLRLKQSLEDELSIQLAQLQEQLIAHERELAKLDEQKSTLLETLKEIQGHNQLSMGLIDLYQEHLNHLRQCRHIQAEQTFLMKGAVDTKRNDLIQATKERKTLEQLRVKEFQDFQEKRLRREQRALDEVGVNLFYRSQSSSSEYWAE